MIRIRRSKGGGYMASQSVQTKSGPVQVAGFHPLRIIAIWKCLETKKLVQNAK